MDLGTSFMTEEKARHYAKVLSRGMGVTFHAVRSREGRFMAVQIPSDDCEILATIRPPGGVNGSRPSAASNSEGLLNVIAGESAGSTALRPKRVLVAAVSRSPVKSLLSRFKEPLPRRRQL
jgi:hypothetical protein